MGSDGVGSEAGGSEVVGSEVAGSEVPGQPSRRSALCLYLSLLNGPRTTALLVPTPGQLHQQISTRTQTEEN